MRDFSIDLFKKAEGKTSLVSEVIVDGQHLENSVRSLELHAGVGEFPTLRLELVLPTGEVNGKAQVYVCDDTRRLLENFGWTAPADQPPHGDGEPLPSTTEGGQ